jgi:hypothetical protein
MSSESTSPFAPTDRMLRQFSGLWIVFFGAIAARQEFHHHRHVLALVLAVAALTIGILGLAWPRGIKPIFIGWMALAYPIGWIVSRVILGALFYGLFTPVAWIFRMIGRDALGLRPQPQAATYWLPKSQAPDKSQYLRQF